MVTYGDGIADINLMALAARHKALKKKHDVVATITITRPYSKYGIVKMDGNLVETFREKPLMDEFINVGFMVVEEGIFSYIPPGEVSCSRRRSRRWPKTGNSATMSTRDSGMPWTRPRITRT